MGVHATHLRAVAAVPLSARSRLLIESLEPRVSMIADDALMPPMRGPADWSGDPSFRRTAEQQAHFDSLVDEADALFGIPDVNPGALARAAESSARLRWVMTTAAGGGSQVRDAQLSASALERIVFTTSAGVHARPLAEFAVFGVLAGSKDLQRLQRDQQELRWPQRWEMRHLDEMTVLVVGLGGIGAECARSFRALGSRVWGANRSGRAIGDVDRVVRLDELAHVVGEVDAIVLALPGTARTHHVVDRDLLALVKPGVTVVNVGRGSVLDEVALLRALDDGRVGFAALDVFEVEPLTRSSLLWAHPRVLISPHTAALSFHEEERVARRFAENATRLLDGRPMLAVVDTVEFY